MPERSASCRQCLRAAQRRMQSLPEHCAVLTTGMPWPSELLNIRVIGNLPLALQSVLTVITVWPESDLWVKHKSQYDRQC